MRCDFRDFAEHIPADVPADRVVMYAYLIPKMVNNRDLKATVARLLEGGAVCICWHYFPEGLPYLSAEDEKFKLRIYRKPA